MTTALDTNVLIDVLETRAVNSRWVESTLALQLAATQGRLIISEAVFAELGAGLESLEAVQEFLSDFGIDLVPSSPSALYRAGTAWRTYLRRRRPGFSCPQCGATQPSVCVACGTQLRVRQHTLADFLIGAHALVHADRLLTRDRRYYASFFPELALA